MSILKLLRPEQYIKNIFVFIPLFFSGDVLNYAAFVQAFWIFLVFCLVASSIYIINDINDIEEDKKHPKKKLRVLASGKLCISSALIVFFCLLTGALLLSYFLLNFEASCIILIYFLLNLAYTYFLKHISLLDVTCISLGFVLRVLAGFTVVASLSQWLILLVFLLCMFLALAKRWDDLCISENDEVKVGLRKSMLGYNEPFLLSAMVFFATINTICYIMYTLDSQTQIHYHSENVYFTSLWVILGNLRYLQIAFVEQKSGSPSDILLHDKVIRFIAFAWIIHLFCLLYF